MPFYAVAKGLNPGIYETWPECKANVDGFGGAKYKKFPTQKGALDFIKKFGNGVKMELLNKENQPETSGGNTGRQSGLGKRKGEQKSYHELMKLASAKKSKDDDKKSAYPEGLSDKDPDYEPYNTLQKTKDGYLLKKDGETYVVYTDGACPGNQNKKGLRFSGSGVWWGPAKADSVPNPRFESEYSTNNFGEALAILYAVR